MRLLWYRIKDKMTTEDYIEAIEAARSLVYFGTGIIKQSTSLAAGAVDVALQTVLVLSEVAFGIAGEVIGTMSEETEKRIKL